MIDDLIVDQFRIDNNRLSNCYNTFNQLVYSKQVPSHKFTNNDKLLLIKLLNNVNDNTNYEYPLQKLYVYMIILFSNFVSEGVFLDIDDDYINIIITVILNSNIIEELFKLL